MSKKRMEFCYEADIFFKNLIINKLISFFPDHLVISEELDNSNTNFNHDGSYIIIDQLMVRKFVSGLKEELLVYLYLQMVIIFIH